MKPNDENSAATYVCIEGPEFSTLAEATMHRALGADVVGMTALPEARLATANAVALVRALVADLTVHPPDARCWHRRRPSRAELPGAQAGLETAYKAELGPVLFLA